MVGFIVLPLALRLEVDRPNPAAAPTVAVQVAPWLGLVGIALRRAATGGWQIGPAVAGCAPGPWWTSSRGAGVTQKASPLPADAPEGERLDGAQDESAGEPCQARADGAAGRRPALTHRRHQLALGRRLARPALRLLQAAPSSFTLHRLYLEGVVGLDDPAATGRLCGLLYALGGWHRSRVRVRVAADFISVGVRGRATVSVRLHLGRALWHLARFGAAAGLHWWRWRRRWRGVPPATMAD